MAGPLPHTVVFISTQHSYNYCSTYLFLGCSLQRLCLNIIIRWMVGRLCCLCPSVDKRHSIARWSVTDLCPMYFCVCNVCAFTVKQITVKENNRTQMWCKVPFLLPTDAEIVWRYAVVRRKSLQIMNGWQSLKWPMSKTNNNYYFINSPCFYLFFIQTKS